MKSCTLPQNYYFIGAESLSLSVTLLMKNASAALASLNIRKKSCGLKPPVVKTSVPPNVYL